MEPPMASWPLLMPAMPGGYVRAELAGVLLAQRSPPAELPGVTAGGGDGGGGVATGMSRRGGGGGGGGGGEGNAAPSSSSPSLPHPWLAYDFDIRSALTTSSSSSSSTTSPQPAAGEAPLKAAALDSCRLCDSLPSPPPALALPPPACPASCRLRAASSAPEVLAVTMALTARRSAGVGGQPAAETSQQAAAGSGHLSDRRMEQLCVRCPRGR